MTGSGVGAAVALNLVTDTTQAALADGSTLSGHNLTLQATGTDTMTTTSVTGAAGGGVTIAPSVAVSISTVTTDASLGTGAATTIGGALVVSATQTASVTNSASGSASASTAAVGAAVAVIDATHNVTAATNRSLSVGGAATFACDGDDIDERLGDGIGEGDVELGAVGRRRRPGRR